jgi:hypothetical protein
MTESKKSKFVERRKRVDLGLRLLSVFGIFCALIVVAAMVLLSEARPQAISSMDENLRSLRSTWNPRYTRYLLYLMFVGLSVSTIGLVVNAKRLKRRYDNIRYNLVFLWLLAAVGIWAYFQYN